MKHNNLILSFILTIWMSTALNSQSVNCNLNLDASLNQNGVINLVPNMLLNGSSASFDTLWLDISQLDCNDIGLNTVTLFGINTFGTQSSCQSVININDLLPPAAIVKNATVQLDASGQHIVEQADLDVGSFDNCNIYYSFSPSVITCGMPNPLQVTMTVTDDAGNTAYAVSEVHYEDNVGGNLACDSDIAISFPPTSTYEVSLGEVLEYYSGSCQSAVYLTLEVDGMNRPNNILSSADYGKNIVAVVNSALNIKCFADITAFTEACPFPFTENLVNWPSDTVEIDVDYCDLGSVNFSPDGLVQFFGLDTSEAMVTFQPHESCLYPVSTYADIIQNEPNVRRIIRTFTVLEWVNNSVYSYTQTIKINLPEAFICDVLPWNSPIGDCASGHTDTDIVEWPADITVNTSAFLPGQLANNSNVNPNDAQPTLTSGFCGYVSTIYSDDISVVSATQVSIQRTWTLASYTGWIHNYVQQITVNYDAQNTFCAYRRNGDAIPGVEMATGYVTDNTGCVDMSTYVGDVVDPSKVSPLLEGVDINDLLAIYDDVLGINFFNNFYQSYAADINLSGAVTSLDRVLVERMMNGLYTPSKVWTFFDVADENHKNTINKSENNPFNTFIGVKSGDVNDSYDLGNFTNPNINETDLVINNDVLNKGQVYRTPVYNPISEKFIAISMKIKNEASLKLKNVFAPYLPGFSFTENVKIKGDEIEISYVVSEDAMKEGGIFINNNLPLLTFVIEAVENGIMSEEFGLMEGSNNLIKTARFKDAASIKLNWDKVIVNKIDPIFEVQKLQISPNPAHDLLIINNADHQDLPYMIYDMQGRSIQSGMMNSNSVEINNMNSGIYILKLTTQDGKSLKSKFIKQ